MAQGVRLSGGFVVYFFFQLFCPWYILFSDHGLSTEPVLGLVLGAIQVDQELTNWLED